MDIADIRKHLIDTWQGFERGRVDGNTARTHIAFARAIMQTLKAEPIGSSKVVPIEAQPDPLPE
jgi:hypothetical protein